MSASAEAKHYDLLERPKVSEKTFALQEQGKYVFVVSMTATKRQIRTAVEAVYPGSKVTRVNTMMRPGKSTRFRGTVGKRKNTKLAVVSVEDATLDVFGN